MEDTNFHLCPKFSRGIRVLVRMSPNASCVLIKSTETTRHINLSQNKAENQGRLKNGLTAIFVHVAYLSTGLLRYICVADLINVEKVIVTRRICAPALKLSIEQMVYKL